MPNSALGRDPAQLPTGDEEDDYAEHPVEDRGGQHESEADAGRRAVGRARPSGTEAARCRMCWMDAVIELNEFARAATWSLDFTGMRWLKSPRLTS